MPAEAALLKDQDAEDEARRILRDRAAALARVLPTEDPRVHVDVVMLGFGPHRAGIPVEQLSGAFEITAVVALPGVPPFVRGLVVHRAEVLALVDLRPLLGLGKAEGKPARAVIAAAGISAVALAADVVEGPVRLLIDGMAEARSDLGRHPALRGVTRDGVMILDVPGLLNDARLIVHQQPPSPVRRQGNFE